MRRLISISISISLSGAIFADTAGAVDYACPSDPGFCYLDVGNDGCFDPPSDTGPIDDQLQAGAFPSPLPPGTDLPSEPGSIICPPLVSKLVLDGPAHDADWRTAPGSDIVIHRARLQVDVDGRLDLRSGGRIALGGQVRTSSHDSAVSIGELTVSLVAEGDVVIEDDVRNDRRVHSAGQPMAGDVIVESAGGSVTIAPRVRLLGGVRITAATDVDLGERVRIDLLSRIEANAGDVTMRSPICDVAFDSEIEGQNVIMTGLAQLGHRDVLVSTPGLASIEAMSSSKGSILSVHAADVVIGTAARRSKINTLEIVATGSIDVVKATVSAVSVDVETSGTEVRLLDSRFKGRTVANPTMEVVAGPGSTCDLTGSRFKNIDLTTSCDTVIGGP